MKANLRVTVWALDFVRATRERPLWARLLFRLALGRYAYREFIGMQEWLARKGYSPECDYGIESTEYNKDKLPIDFMKIKLPTAEDHISDGEYY